MRFKVVSSWGSTASPSNNSDWIALLRRNNWDDYDYKTSFVVSLLAPGGQHHEIGAIKIGQIGLQEGVPIAQHPVPTAFDGLDESFFSVGQSDKYYINLKSLGADVRVEFLNCVRDVAFDLEHLEAVKHEGSFNTSLMRSLHINTLRTQFHRLANGGERHEAFAFAYTYPQTPQTTIDFSVRPGSYPPTNVHVLIGRNAVGKTTLLTRLEHLVRNPEASSASSESFGFTTSQGGTDSFWNLGTVAFSAFDAFGENSDEESSPSGPNYQYFGLKKPSPQGGDYEANEDATAEVEHDSESEIECEDTYFHKSREDIVDEFRKLIKKVARSKADQFAEALAILSSDPLIGASLLNQQFDPTQIIVDPNADELVDEFRDMSSGHKIVVFTIAGLVSCVDEKTLVLIDEPETHLHPPLLSAFIRAVSNLLIDRNGVAIVATHSPVVLQEVPSSCVWKLSRFGNAVKPERPATETFAENVGTLTREVFGLEVTRSGFYQMLTELVETHDTYEEVLLHLGGQLGSEGKAMVRVLLAEKGSE